MGEDNCPDHKNEPKLYCGKCVDSLIIPKNRTIESLRKKLDEKKTWHSSMELCSRMVGAKKELLEEIERVGLRKTDYMTEKQRKELPELNYIILTATEFEEIRKKHVGVIL